MSDHPEYELEKLVTVQTFSSSWEAELARNPRARSATLRAARRTSAPAWHSLQRGSPQ